MLIGIDASRAIRARPTGTERYSRQLIAALLARSSGYQYRLYFDHPPGNTFAEFDRWQARVIPLTRGWTHLRLSGEVIRNRPDLLVIPSHVIPLLCPVPSIVTIHDVGYLWHREAYTPLGWLLLHLGTLRNVRGATRIIADSQATARDLVQHFKVAPGRIRVAYLGAPPNEIRTDSRVAASYGLPERYFLFVGTLHPRKNLRRILQAFASVARAASVSLALAGAAGRGADVLDAEIQHLGLSERVRLLGYVSPDDLPSLFAGAVGFVFPSLYEGFGLPALEAMAWGAPVIAAKTTSLPEVVGTAGVLVDPLDVNAIAGAMRQLLDDDRLRDRLILAGRQRAAQFTWDRCAAEIEATFVEAARGIGMANRG